MFAQATGDENPIHLDPAFAAGTRFGRPIAHGMLTASYVSALLSSQLPGPGAIYLSQSLEFARPVFAGDRLEIVATVTGWRSDKGRLALATVCRNQAGKTVLTGEAVCLVGELTRVQASPASRRNGVQSH